MKFWRNVTRATGVATLGTTVITALLGRREAGSAYAPLNATSHIAFGDEAARKDHLSLRYTGAGSAINAAAMLSWTVLQELVFGRWVQQGRGRERAVRALAAGAATSAAAYVTDYHVVPERLTPGFEKRLSGKALGITYAVLAGALAIGLICRAEE